MGSTVQVIRWVVSDTFRWLGAVGPFVTCLLVLLPSLPTTHLHHQQVDVSPAGRHNRLVPLTPDSYYPYPRNPP